MSDFLFSLDLGGSFDSVEKLAHEVEWHEVSEKERKKKIDKKIDRKIDMGIIIGIFASH